VKNGLAQAERQVLQDGHLLTLQDEFENPVGFNEDFALSVTLVDADDHFDASTSTEIFFEFKIVFINDSDRAAKVQSYFVYGVV
jgi:hypothetical protein